jgi:adenylylsulfate kinase
MQRSLFIGRFQPFHDGHRAFIDYVLKDNDRKVLVAIRQTEIGPDNPLSLDERWSSIAAAYHKNPRVQIMALPDIDEVVYGRGVGYRITQVRLPPEVESIRGRDLR